VAYTGFDEIAADQARFVAAGLGELDAERRRRVLRIVLDFMREGLAVDTEALDPLMLDPVAEESHRRPREQARVGSPNVKTWRSCAAGHRRGWVSGSTVPRCWAGGWAAMITRR
jgi:hypothetical protein